MPYVINDKVDGVNKKLFIQDSYIMGVWFQDLPKVKKYVMKEDKKPMLVMLSSEKYPQSSLLKFSE